MQNWSRLDLTSGNECFFGQISGLPLHIAHCCLSDIACVCVFPCMDRESIRNPREVIKEDIAIVKYICQHFWTGVFGKKISRLQTDNYVSKHTQEIMREFTVHVFRSNDMIILFCCFVVVAKSRKYQQCLSCWVMQCDFCETLCLKNLHMHRGCLCCMTMISSGLEICSRLAK